MTITYYTEPLGHGRAVLRCDVVDDDGELVMTFVDGSPAPIETVRRYERTVTL